jgi:hydroxyacylglutathione hydrolase
MRIETFPVGPLGCNCSILADDESKTAIVIDPGGDLEEIEARLKKAGLRVAAILHTHTHIDHVAETAGLQRATGAPARIHKADHFMYTILPIQAQFIGMRRAPEVGELDAWLKDGEVIAFGGHDLHVLHTPGHSPGSCCFELRAKPGAKDADRGGREGGDEGVVLFSGDTLFSRSIGRSDLWGGDQDELLRSIRERLYVLPDPTRVVTGHGDATTIGDEKRHNPFVRAR